MYSILPAIVAALFMAYGTYVIARNGFTRITSPFFVMCITTFFWQATWAILFQTHDPATSLLLVKFGYASILFLPTTIYHFLAELSGQRKEYAFIGFSYAICIILFGFLLTSDLFIAGYYQYFFGSYPKAGILHPLHLLQTNVVVLRGLFVTWQKQKTVTREHKTRLRLCITGLFVYFFAAIDYLCNYGVEFYPPGVIFLSVGIGIITFAITHYNLFNFSPTESIVHEMRSALSNILIQSDRIEPVVLNLCYAYEMALSHGLVKPSISANELESISTLAYQISHEVRRSNTFIDMMMASNKESINKDTFSNYDVEFCVSEAMYRYPFNQGERDKIRFLQMDNFKFHGSDVLLIHILFNLIKNALYAIKAAGKGEISISVDMENNRNKLVFSDSGSGISPDTLPHIFDPFFTTKKSGGTGIGLAFCKKVMVAFGGNITCQSVPGEHTTFILEFNPIS